MTTSWRVNGVDLDTSTVRVVVEPGSLGKQDGRRRQTVPRLHALPATESLGDDLPRWTLTFKFVGPAPDRYTAQAAALTALKAADTFTLTAPDAPNEVYFNGSAKTITLAYDGASEDFAFGIGEVLMKVQATEP